MLFVRPGPCIYVLFLEGEFSDSFSFMAACRHHTPLTSPFFASGRATLVMLSHRLSCHFDAGTSGATRPSTISSSEIIGVPSGAMGKYLVVH